MIPGESRGAESGHIKIRKVVLFFLAVGVLLSLTRTPTWAASLSELDAQIAAEERRQKEIDRKIEEYRNSIKQMDKKADGLIDRIDRSKQDAKKAEQDITVLEAHVARLQKSIGVLNEEMGKTKNRINELALQLKYRLVDMYKYGGTEELQLIFAAESAQEVLDSIYLLDRMAKHDQFLIEQLQGKKREIELSQQTLEDHRDRLKKQSQALGQERQKYNTIVNQSNTFLNDIRRQKALAEKAAREMEAAQKAVGETIMTLIRQKKEREEADRKAGRSTKGTVNYLAGRGSVFDWPLRGPISSPFGTRVHPVFKTKSFHSGLDISAPKGTAIRAGAPGEVLFVGWMRGYGQVVIIDHGQLKGQDYSTVYAHMSSTAVREGAKVNAGTVVGAVGNTGTATGYHLHFEVRIGSTAKNPLDYLKR